MMFADRPARVLVVGGTGFVGRHLVGKFATQGWHVTMTSRTGAASTLAGTIGPRHCGVRWSGELGQITELMRSTRPDVVVMLAAHFVAEHQAEDVEPLVDANVRLPVMAMEAARAAGVRRFAAAGTFWEERSDDDSEAVDLYAATRRAAKEFLRYYAAAGDWSAAHVRVCDLYGPADPRHKLFFQLRQAVLTGVPLAMSPGDQLLELVHVVDCARGFFDVARSLMTDGSTGFTEYGLFSESAIRLQDVVAAYEAAVGRNVPVVWGGRPYRAREVMAPRRLPGPSGWAPRIALDEGLRGMERAPGGLLEP